MRGRYPMSEQDEHKVADTPVPAPGHARASLADLLAFLGVLALAGAIALLLDRSGQLSARLAFAGAAGLVVACVNALRRLRRVELRRWRSGQVIYRGSRVAMVSAWGVEGQPPGRRRPSRARPRRPGRAPANAGPVRASGSASAANVPSEQVARGAVQVAAAAVVTAGGTLLTGTPTRLKAHAR